MVLAVRLSDGAPRHTRFACITAYLLGIPILKGHLIGRAARVPGVWTVAATSAVPINDDDDAARTDAKVRMPHAFLRVPEAVSRTGLRLPQRHPPEEACLDTTTTTHVQPR